MRIYLDLVFAVNFIGDFLCLWLVSGIYQHSRVWRRLLGAVVGGLYGVAVVLPGMGVLGSLPIKVAAALLITAAVYLPMPLGELLRAAAMLLISSMLLSGATEFILAHSRGVAILALPGMACVLMLLTGILKGRIYARYLPCELCYRGKKHSTSGFYDSGNRLILAENGMRVIVADERVLKLLIAPEVSAANLAEWVEGVFPIPFSGAAGGVLLGLRLDYAKVGGRRYDDVVLGICRDELPDKIILHSTMV